MVEMTCGAWKKATTDSPSEMSNRSSLKVMVILYLPTLCSEELSLKKATSVELLLLCAGGDTPDPHRAVFAAGDQCLRIHVLELRDRPPEKFF